MQKITYENYSNGLFVSFSTDDPRAFLAEFDGSSVGSTAIVYKPADFDGDRFISANLDARTVTFTAEWYGVKNGRYSIEGSYQKWEEIQRVFVPGNMGRLTWTNGRASRFIECRTSELPNFTRIIGCKLSADFKLVADYPYWQDVQERAFDFSGYSLADLIKINNSCGLPVPFVFTCAGGEPFLGSFTAKASIAVYRPETASAIVIDTQHCTVTSNGASCNQYLSVNSKFFKLLPGENVFRITNMGYTANDCTMTWHDHYLGVNC